MGKSLTKLLPLMVLAPTLACTPVDDMAEETPGPTDVQIQVSEPTAVPATECYIYTCPQTGRSYSGKSDYAARHRCELICGDFCTFEGNICA